MLRRKQKKSSLLVSRQSVLLLVSGLLLLIVVIIKLQNRASISENPHAAACTVELSVAGSVCQQTCTDSADCVSGLGCVNSKCVNPNNKKDTQCKQSTDLSVLVNFNNPSSSVAQIKDISVNGLPFLLSDGTVLTELSLQPSETKNFRAYFDRSSFPVYTYITITSGAFRASGEVRYVSNNQLLFQVPFSKTFLPGKYKLNTDGTIQQL